MRRGCRIHLRILDSLLERRNACNLRGFMYYQKMYGKVYVRWPERGGKGQRKGEIPIGAVIVKDGEIIGRGHNLTETEKDPTAHAEIVAIRQAGRKLGETLGWRRLTGCSMYVTVEPCSMCAGAIVWARIEKLYIGTMDPKAGGCGSVFNIVQEQKLNHQVEVFEIEEGSTKTRCQEIVRDFFRELRDLKKNTKEQKSEDTQK